MRLHCEITLRPAAVRVAGRSRDTERFGGASQLIASALLTILIGVVVIVVAIGLLRGNNASRIVITIFEMLSIIGSVFLAIAYPAGAIAEYFSIALAVIVLILLWTGRANAFFRS